MNSATGWREARSDAAAERILAAAAELFLERGVQETGMEDVARAAGCSRATLYRYFENRQALHLAFAHREARRIVAEVSDRVRDIADPTERQVEAIVAVAESVRTTPHLAAWHRPGALGLLGEILHGSEVIEAFTTAFLRGGRPGPPDDELRDLGQWLLRVIESFIVSPGRDQDEERSMVRAYVVPLLADRVR